MVVATREANEHQRPLAQRFVVPRQGLGRARVAPFNAFLAAHNAAAQSTTRKKFLTDAEARLAVTRRSPEDN